MKRQPFKLALTDREAAKSLSLTLSEFKGLVEAGSLPGPVRIGPYQRWSASTLSAVIDGDNIGNSGFEV